MTQTTKQLVTLAINAMNTSDKVRTQLHAAIESECIDDAGESLRGAARTDWLLANVAKYVGTRYHVTAKIGTHGNTKGRITFGATKEGHNAQIMYRRLLAPVGAASSKQAKGSDPYETIVGAGKRAAKAGISRAKAIAAFTKGYDAAE